MTLQQLRYYCTVCECRNITKAAKKSFVTQPAVTAAIRELEKEYAVRLVDKDGKHIRITKAGERFYQYASQIAQLEHMQHNLKKKLDQFTMSMMKQEAMN